jgi:hypothetical protein
MVRSSRISATKPVFPSYLLPSFNFTFPRRASASSSSSAGESSASTLATTPDNSPPSHDPIAKLASGRRLSVVTPDTLRCSTCGTDLAFTSQIISKGFTGRYGRAFLVGPPTPSAQSLPNIRVGRNENRQLVTGWHVVADISCNTCTMKLGWKYVDAKEQSQKYKVGKYILETERVMTHRSWEDVPEEDSGMMQDEMEDDDAHSSEEIVFDSDDDDECEDVFAGTWDAGEVAKRRSQMVSRRKSEAE